MATLEELKAELARRKQVAGQSLEVSQLDRLKAEAERRGLSVTPARDFSVADVGAGAAGLAMEGIAGFNRGVTGILDFLTVDQINNVRELMGEDAIPTLTQALAGQKGQFSKGTIAEGLPTDIASGAGEMAVAGLTGQGLIQQGAKQLAPTAISTGARVLQSAAQPSIASGGAFGAASGAGEEIGREVGGEGGAVVGAIAAPLAGVGVVQGGKAILGKVAERLGRNSSLISPETGLPSPAFEKALKKRGFDFGSIVDDADNLPVVSGNSSPDDVVEQIIKRKLLNRSTDDALAGLKLEGNKIAADELGSEAIRQGFRPGDVAASKAMNKATKREAMRMLKMNRQILANTSKTEEFRPTDVVGEKVMERFNFIRGKADALRSELDQIAKGSSAADERLLPSGSTSQGLKGLEINAAKVEDTLNSELSNLNIEIPQGMNVIEALARKGAFDGSQISADKTSQRVIKSVVKLLSEPGSDASRAHNLKRQLDTMLDFNKKSSQGLTDAGKKVAMSVRRSLNDVIREVNPRYAKVNDELSRSLETMNNFQKVLGPSIDVFDSGANAAVGQDLRGLLSNRKSRVKLDNAIKAIDSTAKDLGGNFDVNVRNLVQFANTLDNRFGAVADTSLKGELTSSIQQAARGQAGAVDLAVQKLAQEAEKMRGVNDTNALNTLHRILKRQ